MAAALHGLDSLKDMSGRHNDVRTQGGTVARREEEHICCIKWVKAPDVIL